MKETIEFTATTLAFIKFGAFIVIFASVLIILTEWIKSIKDDKDDYYKK